MNTKLAKSVLLSWLLITAFSCTTCPSVSLDDGVVDFFASMQQTRLADNATNFDVDDKLGVFLFYNNYYDASKALFQNTELTYTSAAELDYSPKKTWLFTPTNGSDPYHLDVVSYYPYKAIDVEVVMSGADPILEYTYNPTVAKNHRDFMIAHYSNGATAPSAANTNNLITTLSGLSAIPLTFTRSLASVNLNVMKHPDVTEDLKVDKITVYFKSNQKLQYNTRTKTATWVEPMTAYSTIVVNCNKVSLPNDPATLILPQVSTDLQFNKFFFPPDTEILKIEFKLQGARWYTYDWHPHIQPIQANKHYNLNVILDPDREN